MFYALSWFAIVALFALWSLIAWALHAVLAWTIAQAGTLSGNASGAGSLALPEWLAPWVPAEVWQVVIQLVSGLGPLVDAVLQVAPVLSGGITVLAWVIWGFGSALLLLLGAGLHLLIAVWRRRGRRGSGPSTGPSLAAG